MQKKLMAKRAAAKGRHRPVQTRLLRLGLVLTPLQAVAVAMATQLSYLTALERLQVWLLVVSLPLLSHLAWDDLLEDYLSHLYDRGLPCSVASTTLAAIRWALPTIPRPLRAGLPRASAAWAGWRKAEPGRSRDPVPSIWALAVVSRLCLLGL